MNNSLSNQFLICAYIYTAWNVLYVLLLPLFISVIYIRFVQWRKRQTPSRPSTANHSDIFTFNLAVLDIFGVLGTCVLTGAYLSSQSALALAGYNLAYIVQYGQILFHNLICAERYLAVVHPITYLRMKKKGKVIRNICIVAIWLFSFCMVFAYHLNNPHFNFFSVFVIAISSLVSITFFSASVLWALIRPGPGERGGERKRFDQSKRRAFYTMMAITVVLLLKFAVMFASYLIYLSKTLNEFKQCLFSVSVQWLNNPSSIVPPALFLQQQIRRKNRRKQ